jgi:ssDNA-specific exonuclease RecJ
VHPFGYSIYAWDTFTSAVLVAAIAVHQIAVITGLYLGFHSVPAGWSAWSTAVRRTSIPEVYLTAICRTAVTANTVPVVTHFQSLAQAIATGTAFNFRNRGPEYTEALTAYTTIRLEFYKCYSACDVDDPRCRYISAQQRHQSGIEAIFI